MAQNKDDNYENVHWADNSAQKVIDKFPDEKIYTLASGITPSGYIHIGNFREVITSEMVRRALEDKGKKTKFIYSWDSYDAFRKVPKDIPSEWEKYLRMPDGEVPNPFGKGSYAEEFMKTFENEVSVFNFPIIFQNQYELQSSGKYALYIKKVMQNRHKVIDALNKYREIPLSDDWLPIDVYDDDTRKDTNKIISYDDEYTLKYVNSNGVHKIVNFKDDPRVKLRWKADWPMRWAYYKVNFEPGGKDHSTPGSSYTVGSEIVKEIFDREPPVYTMYDFVKLKGVGGKISSSKGGVIRVADVLKTYTPEMVLFIFAGTRPNSEIDLSFDLDVIKIYEDFDKLERVYYGLESEKNPKKLATIKRIYELSMVNGVKIQKNIPFQPAFRHLTTVSQANNFEYERVKDFYKDSLKTQFDEQRLRQRYDCAKNWIELYAPEDMKFRIAHKIDDNISLDDNIRKVIKNLIMEIPSVTEASYLMGKFKDYAQEYDIQISDLFSKLYLIIIGKEKGPRLANLIIENKEKVLTLLKKVK